MNQARSAGHQPDLLCGGLQGSALAREAMSSAAVALYAAAVLPEVPPTVSAWDLAVGLFLPPSCATQFVHPATPGKTCIA